MEPTTPNMTANMIFLIKMRRWDYQSREFLNVLTFRGLY